jgi:hypothetical protein
MAIYQEPARRGRHRNLLTVPGDDGVRLRNCCDPFSCLPAQFLTHLSQRLTLCVGQPHPSCLHLIAQDAAFRRAIRIAQSEFFIDRALDRGQQLLLSHVSCHLSRCLLLVVSMDYRAVERKMKSEYWWDRKFCGNGTFEFSEKLLSIAPLP